MTDEAKNQPEETEELEGSVPEKPFIRVKDRRTKHHYDIHRSRFDEEIHERVARAPDSWHARPAKPHVDLTAEKAAARKQVADERAAARKTPAKPSSPTTKTSAPEAVEGVSPDPVSAS